MYQRILVALDGSKLAESGLEQAVSLAKLIRNAKLILFTVLEPLQLGEGLSYAGTAGKEFRAKLLRQQEEEMSKYLGNLQAGINAQGITSESEKRHGSAGEEIVKYAESNQIDLIVLTSHGRSGLSKFLLGSVANKVVNTSTIPVLVVPARKPKES